MRALVAIDLQRVFADPGSGWATAGLDAVAAALPAVAERFDAVVFTRFVAPAEPTGAWVDYYREWPWALRPPSDPLWDLVVDPGDAPVVDASTFGKWGPVLAHLVDGAHTVALCGVSTDCCVLSTALAAADAGVRVEVLADLCAGATPADHDRALAAMALYGPLITVTSSTTPA
jgi:nicotinamidase-related amidase